MQNVFIVRRSAAQRRADRASLAAGSGAGDGGSEGRAGAAAATATLLEEVKVAQQLVKRQTQELHDRLAQEARAGSGVPVLDSERATVDFAGRALGSSRGP